MTLNSETLSKITQPGLWFIKSRQPLFNISSLISKFVIDGSMFITIYTTQEEILKNEVMLRFFNDQKNYPDDILSDHDLSEYLDCDALDSTYDFVENFNFLWDSYVDIRNEFSLSCCSLNSSFNPILIDYPSILWYEHEPHCAKDLINEESSILEIGRSVIVFLPERETSFSLDFINNHILNL